MYPHIDRSVLNALGSQEPMRLQPVSSWLIKMSHASWTVKTFPQKWQEWGCGDGGGGGMRSCLGGTTQQMRTISNCCAQCLTYSTLICSAHAWRQAGNAHPSHAQHTGLSASVRAVIRHCVRPASMAPGLAHAPPASTNPAHDMMGAK